MQDIHPTALFRLTVLGPLACRERLVRGELKATLAELAKKTYDIPNTRRCHLSEKTIEAWFYAWKKGGIKALAPKHRRDAGRSKMAVAVQESILSAKRDRPSRSINQIITLLENKGQVGRGSLSRSSVHRLLHAHGLSGQQVSDVVEERRAFETEYAGQIWYGDVMHGPRIKLDGVTRKTYLVSLMDDASRLITHSAFHLDEKALSIESVLKQALLKRGLPSRLVIDNGAAYRSATLQGICARLDIRLIYCRPYQPEGKGKLERWHRTLRAQFLDELDHRAIGDLDQLNARLWVWVEQDYHRRIHSALDGKTPLQRFMQDLVRMRQLGPLAARIDALFYYQVKRTVRKDNTVSYEGNRYEVPLGSSGRRIQLVVDPQSQVVIAVEDESGCLLGPATALDLKANTHRKRNQSSSPASQPVLADSAIELLYQNYRKQMQMTEE